MRVAVSGSHSTGKSSLISAFLERRPEYVHEPEAYEALADDIPLTSEGPTLEGLEVLLQHTIGIVAGYGPGAHVVFERSAVDYLAYAVEGEAVRGSRASSDFLDTHLPAVRASVLNLDLIAFLPVSRGVVAREGEDDRLRRRVDERLRRALVEDDYELFGEEPSPVVVELSPMPERQLAELIRLTESGSGGRGDGHDDAS